MERTLCPNTTPPAQELTKHDVGWRRIVRNFTPSWFSVTMGTGIVSILLNTLPYNAPWLYWISVVLFAVNVLLFGTGCIISVLRYILYPEVFTAMISHPVQSMFIGTFPMGLATIINMFCFVCVPVWGEWTRNCAWGLWIVDAVLSVVVALSLPFLLMANGHETQLSSMTAVWLLPVVSCVVAASSGAIVADILPNPQHALWTVIVSYILWGIGVPLALMVMVIYLQRLTLHKLPPKAVIVSVFLPLGPLGQGGYGAMKLGQAAQSIFPQTHTLDASAGPMFYTLGFLVALILWSFGLVWLFFASASIARHRNFPFNIGWWGFTFPLGVFATSTCQMGRELPSEFFRVLGTILSLCVVVLWMVVSMGTLKGVVSGQLFFAPCLADLKMKEADGNGEKRA
ncbi:TDT family transporter [Aspergillus clavatus NRRL 1]|uniref:C4-dicarboxylate transporter/malic acid transport protein, putative n=1 Tax=Aspergillus clavatus (strain ATCC 1007 / CBS 513.65 / DSM 816 / NCTC 3887 / NRRL 1 / QM 1276 / 107) TaxID=344612 RepID=A1CG61_ASPCL|nr:C4-dicarboxylate transporter/malic acid transport protein, putative [Aspergillus clavatus NRRL 1]EAW10941.1 C4-dicarboxylate transporter/malic acid transport protein, putative [Aspergillus clavatus NRRL 1]